MSDPICYLCKKPITDPKDVAWKQGFSDNHPFHQECAEKPLPDITTDDGTPALAEQCDKNGWEFGYYHFGKGEIDGRTFFNPSIVSRPDGLWLLCRLGETFHQFGQNSIYAFKLDETGKIPAVGYRLEFDGIQEEQHEDPRAAYFEPLNQVVVCCTNFRWYGQGDPVWTGALQKLGFFDQNWHCKVSHRPPIGGNPPTLQNVSPVRYEKSWCPFFHKNELHIMYAPDPWKIIRFGQTWEDFNGYDAKQSATWKFGKIRNGSPPVLYEGKYWVFIHSSLPWKSGYRRYFMGAVAFEAKPPFTPLLITPDILLAGSQHDTWKQRKPPAVFPCGAVIREGKWTISAGVNDLRACWIEIPHESLIERMKPIGATVTPIFPQTGLTQAEVLKEKRRAQAAKARAALAAKRANKKSNALSPAA